MLFSLLRIFLVILFVACTSTNILAQITDDTETAYDTVHTKRTIKLIKHEQTTENYKKGDISIYFSPLAIIEPRPTILIGGEYFINDRLSIYTDIGYLFNLTGTKIDTELDPTISAQEQSYPSILNSSKLNYVIKPEIRWYRKNSSPKNGEYYGVRLLWRDVNFLKNQRTFEEYAFSTLTNTWTAIGNEQISVYQVKRQTLGLQFLMGTKGRLFKGINSNLYAGVGVRYINNRIFKKAFDPFDTGNLIIEDLNLEFLDFSKEYKVITIDFALGVRLGTRIKQ